MESAAVNEPGVDEVTAVSVEAAETPSAETTTTAPAIAEQTEPAAAAIDESAQPVPAEAASEEQPAGTNARSRPSFRELFGYKRPGSPYGGSRFSRPPGPMGYGDQSAVEGDEAGFPPRQPASRMYGPGPMGYGRGYGYPSNSGYGYPSNQGYGYGYGGYRPYNQGMGYPGMPVR